MSTDIPSVCISTEEKVRHTLNKHRHACMRVSPWQCKCRCQSAPARLAQSRRHHPGPTLLSLLLLGPSQQNHFSAMSGWHGVWQRPPTNIASGGTAGPQAPLLSRCWFWNICHEIGSFLQALCVPQAEWWREKHPLSIGARWTLLPTTSGGHGKWTSQVWHPVA